MYFYVILFVLFWSVFISSLCCLISCWISVCCVVMLLLINITYESERVQKSKKTNKKNLHLPKQQCERGLTNQEAEMSKLLQDHGLHNRMTHLQLIRSDALWAKDSHERGSFTLFNWPFVLQSMSLRKNKHEVSENSAGRHRSSSFTAERTQSYNNKHPELHRKHFKALNTFSEDLPIKMWAWRGTKVKHKSWRNSVHVSTLSICCVVSEFDISGREIRS